MIICAIVKKLEILWKLVSNYMYLLIVNTINFIAQMQSFKEASQADFMKKIQINNNDISYQNKEAL